MVKVVGQTEKYTKQVCCKNCSSVLEYKNSDIHSEFHYDYLGDRDVFTFITCPSCSSKVHVKLSFN